MKNNFIKYLILAILIIVFLLWVVFLRYALEDKFYNISEWGGYLLVIPLISSVMLALHKKLTNRIIIAILIGAMLPIMLSREFDIILLCQKTLMMIAGALVTMFLLKKRAER